MRRFPEKKIPFCTVLAGALPRCPSLVWLATRRSGRLALHPASTVQNGIFFPENRLSTWKRSAIETFPPGREFLTSTSEILRCPLCSQFFDYNYDYEYGPCGGTSENEWIKRIPREEAGDWCRRFPLQRTASKLRKTL